MLNIKSLQFVLLALLPLGAHADWADPLASYRCDKSKGIFDVKAVMLTSSSDIGTVPFQKGYSPFKTDKNFKCVLGQTTIEAEIEVKEPRPGGNCAAYTYTYIHSLRVNGKDAFPHWQLFNSPCEEGPVLYSIRIKQDGEQAHFEACFATWGWGKGYQKTSCEAKNF